MTTTLHDRSIGSRPACAPLSESGQPEAAPSSVEQQWGFFAEIAARHTGRSVEEERAALEQALRRPSPGSAQAQAADSVGTKKRAALEEVQARIQKKFSGKLERGSALLARQAPELPRANAAALELPDSPVLGLQPAPLASPCADARADAAAQDYSECGAPARRRESPGTREAGLSRNQRRVLIKVTARELERQASRFIDKNEPQRAGVWSREDYRRIRAGVQDASGRAASCLLYQLGSREAATMAAELDPRVPMDRRKIAFAYAVARAPGGSLGETIKMGFAMGLWSAVLADPNNPNMERRRQYRPSRRTLSSDLTWLEERRVLKRWQVKMEHAAPCERKTNPVYPTNRYHAPVRRVAGAMMEICQGLGDMPPMATPGPSEQWTEDDADLLRELRSQIARQLSGGPLPNGPPN